MHYYLTAYQMVRLYPLSRDPGEIVARRQKSRLKKSILQISYEMKITFTRVGNEKIDSLWINL